MSVWAHSTFKTVHLSHDLCQSAVNHHLFCKFALNIESKFFVEIVLFTEVLPSFTRKKIEKEFMSMKKSSVTEGEGALMGSESGTNWSDEGTKASDEGTHERFDGGTQ